MRWNATFMPALSAMPTQRTRCERGVGIRATDAKYPYCRRTLRKRVRASSTDAVGAHPRNFCNKLVDDPVWLYESETSTARRPDTQDPRLKRLVVPVAHPPSIGQAKLTSTSESPYRQGHRERSYATPHRRLAGVDLRLAQMMGGRASERKHEHGSVRSRSERCFFSRGPDAFVRLEFTTAATRARRPPSPCSLCRPSPPGRRHAMRCAQPWTSRDTPSRSASVGGSRSIITEEPCVLDTRGDVRADSLSPADSQYAKG